MLVEISSGQPSRKRGKLARARDMKGKGPRGKRGKK